MIDAIEHCPTCDVPLLHDEQERCACCGATTCSPGADEALARGWTHVMTAAGPVEIEDHAARYGEPTILADDGSALLGPWRPLTTIEEMALEGRGEPIKGRLARDRWDLLSIDHAAQ